MDARTYDQWYETPRGKWIGHREASLILENLQPRAGESLLDVGCGTGFFTRTLATALDGRLTGVDINPEWIEYARCRDGRVSYEVVDACALPYANDSFDLVMSVTALCFIKEEMTAVRDIILRVARRRFAIGLLNKYSLLYIKKGRRGGQKGYRGAHWHSAHEVIYMFRNLPVQHLQVYTIVQIPSGGWIARLLERVWPSTLPFGAFILVVGDIAK